MEEIPEWNSVSGQENVVSGRVLRDTYDNVLRPSFFQWTKVIWILISSFPVSFIHWKNEGRRTLSYLSRNTLPDTKSSCPDAEFHSGICSTSSGISSGRIYLANSGRIYLASSSKFFDRIFVQGNFWISYRENPGYLTLSEGRSSDQQAEGRKSDLRLMFRNRFQSGIPYHDRRISYLGEYCGIDTIRSSGLHSFNDESNLDPDQFFPGFFYH